MMRMLEVCIATLAHLVWHWSRQSKVLIKLLPSLAIPPFAQNRWVLALTNPSRPVAATFDATFDFPIRRPLAAVP